ncbi:MAG: phospholipase D-like domain-containing protein [Gaiellaceae bacterium]
MDPRPIPLLSADGCLVVTGDDLAAVAVDEAERARTRLWVSMFLVGLSAADDLRLSVRFVLDAVVRAHRRGVDVRVIIDDFRFGTARVSINSPAAGYLADRGVPVRIWVGTPGRASHSKLMIGDETVVCGSGNWTPGGLDRNTELALRVRSQELASDLAGRFELGWAEAEPWIPREAPVRLVGATPAKPKADLG